MKINEYHTLIGRALESINADADTFNLFELHKQNLELPSTEDIHCFIQIVKDPHYSGIVVESFLISKKITFDLMIGINSFRFNTIPTNTIKKVSINLIPLDKNLNELKQYVRFYVQYGYDVPSKFSYNSSSDKFIELLELKNNIIKMITS